MAFRIAALYVSGSHVPFSTMHFAAPGSLAMTATSNGLHSFARANHCGNRAYGCLSASSAADTPLSPCACVCGNVQRGGIHGTCSRNCTRIVVSTNQKVAAEVNRETRGRHADGNDVPLAIINSRVERDGMQGGAYGGQGRGPLGASLGGAHPGGGVIWEIQNFILAAPRPPLNFNALETPEVRNNARFDLCILSKVYCRGNT